VGNAEKSACAASVRTAARLIQRSGREVLCDDVTGLCRKVCTLDGQCSTGFQYVITSAGVPVAATVDTAPKMSRVWTPRSRAAVPARWIAMPSITGSE